MRRPLLCAASLLAFTSIAHAQPSTVVLVRHAERATAPANDPVLTAAGSARADALRAALADAHVAAIITTHLQRTQLTARPLADKLGLALTIVRAGSPLRAHLDSVAATVRRQPDGSTVLVVGHSNTVPGIIAALGGPKMADLCDSEYASLFILSFPDTGAPRLIRSSYGAADGPPGEDCARTMRP
jgi:broad specificity phosphatase PhoE